MKGSVGAVPIPFLYNLLVILFPCFSFDIMISKLLTYFVLINILEKIAF